MAEPRRPKAQANSRAKLSNRPAKANSTKPNKPKRNTTKPESLAPTTETTPQPKEIKISPDFPALPLKLDYVIIAEVASPFGLRGAFKANILTDFPERFERLEEVFLAPPGVPLDAPRERYEVMSSRIQNEKQAMIRLTGVSKIEQAEKLRGYTVAIPIEEIVALPEGEYYIFQIIGLDVYTTSGEFVGKVINVESRTANDVYIVRGPISSKDILLPAIKDVVKNIDLQAGRITVDLLDGLLDL